jgi:hypothetical protein
LSVPHLPVHDTKTCPNCFERPPEEHCRQIFLVDCMANASQYENAALTEADPHDQLEPQRTSLDPT